MRESVDVVLHCLIVEVEHAILMVEQLLYQELKELLSYTSLVNAWLTMKDDSHRFLEVLVRLSNDSECIVKDVISANLKQEIHCMLTHHEQLVNIKALSLLVYFVLQLE